MTDVVEPAALDPIAIARALHERFEVASPGDLHLETIASHCKAFVVYRDTASADARVERDGRIAYIVVSREARRTPRGRFSIAHELGHHLLHPDVDAIARLHGAPRVRGREFRYEKEADAFAAELLVPSSLFVPRVARTRPSLAELTRVAGDFRVSLSVIARKWPSYAAEPCAFVESRGGTIREVHASPSFRGKVVRRRSLDETRALGWNAEARLEIVEESVAFGELPTVLSWLVHA